MIVDVFANDERKKKEAEERARVHQREISDVRAILKIPAGRRFIWRLWTMTGIFINPFTANSNQTAYNAGRMSIGQDILGDVNETDATVFAQIQQEYVSETNSKKTMSS